MRNSRTRHTRKLRIAMVTCHPPGLGSLNEYAYHFVRFLRRKPEIDSIHLLVDELPDGESYETFQDPTAPVDALPLNFVTCWKFGALNNATRIVQTVRKLRPDVVLFNIQFASFGAGKVAAAIGLTTPMLVKAAGYKTMVLLHNIMETVDLKSAGFGNNAVMERIIRTFGTLSTRMILQADLVALTIPKYVEILADKYGADNVVLAPHGSFEGADEAQPPSFELPDGPMQIMTFGKFGTYKKVDGLIEAFRDLTSNGRPPLELVIAGSDSPNAKGYLQSMRDKYSDVANVRYTGYVAEEDVPVIFGEAAVVVFPYTSTTGSSGVLHQAGDYGKAVVLPDIGDFAEVIREEGYTGEFFEPNCVDSLANAIGRVIDDPDNRRRIGTQNYGASHGIAIDEIVDWYILHMQTMD